MNDQETARRDPPGAVAGAVDGVHGVGDSVGDRVAAPILTSALGQVDADLALVPAGVDRVLVTAADDKGFSAGFAARLGDGWRMSATVEQRWKKQRPHARVTLVKTW